MIGDRESKSTLFKLSKTGAILKYDLIARSVEDGAILITRKGQLNGAIQEDLEVMLPKNVGRANETTPYQQALLMYTSKINKLRDKSYKVLPEGVGSLLEIKQFLESTAGTDASGKLLPMLAQKNVKKITFWGFLQRKYDGVRCFIEWVDGKIQLRSRRGKIFIHLKHIEQAAALVLKPGEIMDGELYSHRYSLQQIVSMVKRNQVANKYIKFRAYDLVDSDNAPFEIRTSRLHLLKAQLVKTPISIAKTYIVNSMEELMILFDKFKALGYEGAMWRDPKGRYESGIRSWGLIKVKDFLEKEFVIIGAEEATGRDKGTAIFVCQTSNGVTFNCRPMGSRELRRDYLRDIDQLKGEMLTVRFQAWTDDGKPFHARGVNVRDYEIQG